MALALKMDVCSATNCKSFDVTDTTGAYSATNTGGFGAPNLTTSDVLTATIAVTAYGASTPIATVNVLSELPSSTSGKTTISNTELGYTSTATIPQNVYQILYTITGTIAVVSADVGASTFTVSGNRSGVFEVGETFTISGGSTNAGTYTVTAISYSSPNTTINVTPAPASATVTSNVINFTEYVSQYELFACTTEACLDSKLSKINVTECAECLNEQTNLIKKIDIFLQAAKKAAGCSKPAKAQVLLSYTDTLCNLLNCTDC